MRFFPRVVALLGSGLLWCACQASVATPPAPAAPGASAAPSASAPRVSASGLLVGDLPGLEGVIGSSFSPLPEAGSVVGDVSLSSPQMTPAAWRALPAPRSPLVVSLSSSDPRGYLQASLPPRVFSARKPTALTCGNTDPWTLRHQTINPVKDGEVSLSWTDYLLDFRECSITPLLRGETPASVLLSWGKLPVVLGLRSPTAVHLMFPLGTRLQVPPRSLGVEIETDAFVHLRVLARAGVALSVLAEIDGPRLVAWSTDLGIDPGLGRPPSPATVILDLSQTVSDRDMVIAASFVRAP
jgi:hypothetical protein